MQRHVLLAAAGRDLRQLRVVHALHTAGGGSFLREVGQAEDVHAFTSSVDMFWLKALQM
jgi:hypothetical protein